MSKQREIGRGRYYANHYEDVTYRKAISKSILQNGMIVSIEYRASYRVSKKLSLYMIISPDYAGYVHVIDLDYVKPSEFQKFINLCIGKGTKKIKLGNQDIFIFPFVLDKEPLYRAIVPLVHEQSYRKLIPKKIRALKVCNLATLENYFKEPGETKEERERKKKDNKDNKSDIPKPKEPDKPVTENVESKALADAINKEVAELIKKMFK